LRKETALKTDVIPTYTFVSFTGRQEVKWAVVGCYLFLSCADISSHKYH